MNTVTLSVADSINLAYMLGEVSGGTGIQYRYTIETHHVGLVVWSIDPDDYENFMLYVRLMDLTPVS